MAGRCFDKGSHQIQSNLHPLGFHGWENSLLLLGQIKQVFVISLLVYQPNQNPKGEFWHLKPHNQNFFKNRIETF